MSNYLQKTFRYYSAAARKEWKYGLFLVTLSAAFVVYHAVTHSSTSLLTAILAGIFAGVVFFFVHLLRTDSLEYLTTMGIFVPTCLTVSVYNNPQNDRGWYFFFPYVISAWVLCFWTITRRRTKLKERIANETQV